MVAILPLATNYINQGWGNNDLLYEDLSNLIGIIFLRNDTATPISFSVHSETFDALDETKIKILQLQMASTITFLNCSPVSIPVLSIQTLKPSRFKNVTIFFTLCSSVLE